MIGAVLLSAVIGAAAVSTASSLVNLSNLDALGVELPLSVRLETIGRDWIGFGPTLAAVMLLALVIALPVGALGARLLRLPRVIGYALASSAAVVVTMLVIEAYYSMTLGSTITPVPTARTLAGLAAMGGAGGVAGLVYALFAPRTA